MAMTPDYCVDVSAGYGLLLLPWSTGMTVPVMYRALSLARNTRRC